MHLEEHNLVYNTGKHCDKHSGRAARGCGFKEGPSKEEALLARAAYHSRLSSNGCSWRGLHHSPSTTVHEHSLVLTAVLTMGLLNDLGESFGYLQP